MSKRELKALEREQADRHAARCAVYAALWADPAYKRMAAHLDKLNHAVTLAKTELARAAVSGTVGGLGTQAAVDATERRFTRYHRRVQAIEHAALVKAGFPNG